MVLCEQCINATIFMTRGEQRHCMLVQSAWPWVNFLSFHRLHNAFVCWITVLINKLKFYLVLIMVSYFQKSQKSAFLLIQMHIKELKNLIKIFFLCWWEQGRCQSCAFCDRLVLILNGWCISSAPHSGMLKCSSFISRSIFACDHFILAHWSFQTV